MARYLQKKNGKELVDLGVRIVRIESLGNYDHQLRGELTQSRRCLNAMESL